MKTSERAGGIRTPELNPERWSCRTGMGFQLSQNMEVQCSREADGERPWQEGETRGLSSGSGG